ncbi:MAG TPA: creatininase family protein [bacterium]|nr:creatininase family protein [bacterium]
MADEVRFELMRPPQIVEARRKCPVAYLAVGPLEWHGPHLPMGTDAMAAHRVAVEVARRVGGVVLPAYHLGTETVRVPDGPQGLRPLGFEGHERIVGMDFPGNPVKSLYIEEGTFAVIIREIVRLLKQDDYRLIVIVNGHGAPNHQRALRRVAAEENDPPRVHVLFERAGSGPAHPSHDPGHAGRGETAFMMVEAPGSVDLGALPPIDTPLRYPDYGIVNGAAFDGRPTPDFTVPREADPRSATREEGVAALERNVERLAAQMRKYIAAYVT